MLATPPATAFDNEHASTQPSSHFKEGLLSHVTHDELIASLEIATPSKMARRVPDGSTRTNNNARQISGPFEARLARLQALALRQLSHAGQADASEEDETASAERIDEAADLLKDLQAEDDIAWALQGRQAAAYLDDMFTTLSTKQKETADDELAARLREAGPALARVRIQLHAADDYEDCRGSLDAIEQEIKSLRTAIYQVEEQRHVAVPPEAIAPDVLAGILREEPEGEDTGTPGKVVGDDLLSRWDRQLTETMMQLSSRLQPLRASISLFRPRIEVFEMRAAGCFPTAVVSLQEKYTSIEGEFSILSRDFGTLKQELGEDKWMAVFRQVNKQASDMMESLERTAKRLGAAPFKGVDAEKLATAFEMKAEHYGKAIPAVLNIMHAGVKNRATLNGEVIRGYDLLLQRWHALEKEIDAMHRRLESARAGGMMRRTLGAASGNRQSPERKSSASLLKSASKGPHPRLLQPGTPRRIPKIERCESPSPALFRRDVSLDPPRSRSRLSMHGGGSSTQTSLSPQKPPWNAGTAVARMPDSRIPLTPMRSASRLASHETGRVGGAQSSLGFHRASGATTPVHGSRRASVNPRGTPSRAASGVMRSPVPPLPTHLTAETIERLSRPKAPQLGKLPPPPLPAFQTPVKQQGMSRLRPITPSGIPSLKKGVPSSVPGLASTRRERVSGIARPQTSDAVPELRAPSIMGTAASRRSSMLPVPSPRRPARS
ncbi:cortical protein KAR9-domain-containing protein [Protomyces lactucae-debilis]|uniref:Cortical protein KAR9-domain-containing protein n=1 Tax=Protomyces lactucae-debilis TaxID=2754530 RepID=A0A1Y2F230_PROLT|nr:cortical protein KAR9-domain-containing protein [Protomyces lactucae-debilis]ORY77406.1 cortical protein KAR9-domain-containing protein [Protomyces lactucae-debilis]